MDQVGNIPSAPNKNEPPEWLVTLCVSVHYILKQVHDTVILIGMILITAMAVYAYYENHGVSKPSPPSSPVTIPEVQPTQPAEQYKLL
jgi:hypothetical protein